MKRVMFFVFLIFCILNVSAENKVAVVNMLEVVTHHPEAQLEQKKMESEFSERISEVKKMQEQHTALSEKLRKDSAIMSKQDVEKLEAEIVNLERQYKFKAQFLEEDMQKRQDEARTKLLTTVTQAINAIAEEEHYDMVIEARTFLFLKPQFDISQKVIARLSKIKK